MKTTEYQVTNVQKHEMLRALQVVAINLNNSIAQKRTAGFVVTPEFKAAHKVLRDQYDTGLKALQKVNAELRKMREAGIAEAPKVAKVRAERKTKLASIADLKEALTKRGVKFVNRGIFLQVEDKKVTFALGKFYINKVATEATEVLKAL
jgi:prefoldin subunit 5